MLDTPTLRELCKHSLARGELWTPYVVAERDNLGKWFWHDKHDDCRTYHGPFPTERAALLDAIDTERLEDV